ncbi:hypothetical protein [Aquirufa sp. TARAVU-A1A]
MSITNLYVYTFATFGHPNDFRQSPVKYSKPEVARKIKVFDLTNAIKVFPESVIYSIRKEKVENSNLIAYSIYSYAQEQTSKRDGTFIGSSLILENKIAKEHDIIEALNGVHENLIEENLDNGILKVNHSDQFNLYLSKTHFDKVINPKIDLPDIDFSTSNNNLVVYCDTAPSELEIYFNKSIDLLNDYDTIYFTNNEDVIRYVNQRGLFKWIQNVGDKKEFDNQLEILALEKNRKREQQLSDLESRIQNIKEERKQEKENFNQLSEQNDRVVAENQKKVRESKENFAKIDDVYDNFINKSNQILNQVKQKNLSIDVALKTYQSNRVKLREDIEILKSKNSSSYLGKVKGLENTETHNDRYSAPINPKPIDFTKNKETADKSNPYKIISIILGIALLCTLSYFLIFSENASNKSDDKVPQNEYYDSSENNDAEVHDSASQEDGAESTNQHLLNPLPNNELNDKEIKIISKKLKSNSSIDEVVDIIFENHKKDINSHYSEQKNLYKENLYELNKNCFEVSNGIKKFTKKDTLRHIPYFKKSE